MKIAFITNGPHFTLGGVENYADIFYEYFADKYEITEFPTLNIDKNYIKTSSSHPNIKIDYSLLGWKPHFIVWGGSYTKKNYQKIYQNYDLVIINTMFLPKKWLKHPKNIMIQHMDKKWYKWGGKKPLVSWGQLVNSLLFNVSTITNAFKHVNNVVFYAPETATFTYGKKWFIPLTNKNAQNLTSDLENNKSGFVWISRLDNQQKNVRAIVRLANINPDITIYGQGHSKKIIDKYLQNKNQYQGMLPKEAVNKKIQQAKGLLITSHFEGMSFSAIEALSNGTPVILFDTFAAVQFLIKSGAVFTVPKGDIAAFDAKIKWIRNLPAEDYQKICQNAINFAQQHFAKESFWTSWQNVLVEYQAQYQKLLTVIR